MTKKTRWIILVLPTLIVGVVIIVLLNWHISTLVRIGLKVNRVAFTVGGKDSVRVIESLGLKSISVQEFAAVKLIPARLTPRSERPLQVKTNATAKRLDGRETMTISPAETRALPNISLSVPSENKNAVLLIDSINAAPDADLILETTEDGDLIMHVRNQQSSGKITSAGPLVLAVDQVKITGAASNLPAGEQAVWMLELARDSSIEFMGQEKSLTLALTAPGEAVSKFFPQGRIPLKEIKFEKMTDGGGVPLSSLLTGSTAEISYPDYSAINKVTATSPDFVSLDSLEKFSVEEMRYDPAEKAITITMQGVAGKIATGSSDYKKDLRLTLYDSIWNNHKIIALFIAVVWVAGATAALNKFVKEN